MDEILEVVGKNIRRARKALGLSQGELAASVGISQQSIYLYEQGSRQIATDKMIRVAAVLGRSWLWFYQDHSAQETPADTLKARAQAAFMEVWDKMQAESNGGLTECEDTDIDEINFCDLPPLRTPAESAAFIAASQIHRTKDLLGIIQVDDSRNPRNLYRRA